MNERQRLGIRDIPKAVVGKVSGEFILKGTGIELVDPNNYLAIAQEYLEKGPVVVAFSHFDDDYAVWGKFSRTLTSLDHIAILVAMQYLDSKRGTKSKFKGTVMRSWEKGLGIEIIPIVQTYDRSNYPNADSINVNSLRRTLKFLQEPGHVLAIAPEGTRSKNGGLSEAQEGVGAILRNTPNALILPVAAIPSPVKLFKTTTQIYVGAPLFHQELEDEYIDKFGNEGGDGKKKRHDKEIADLLMRRIAILLPEQNRGYYQIST